MATIMRASEKHGAEPTEYFLIGEDNGQKLRIYQRRILVAGLRELGIKDTSRCQLALLLGHHSSGEDWVDVAAAVKVRSQDGQYGDNVWRVARAMAEQRYPTLEVVGWATTHPNMGLELTTAERELHARYFPKSYHVIYVSDPVSNERCFYYQQAGSLAPAGGFRVYGKGDNDKGEATKMERENIKRQDERIRDRYLEHGLDKVIKRLDSPTVRTVDWIIIGMLILVLGLVMLKPQKEAKVDDSLLKKIEVISTNVSEVNSRVSRLESQLKAVNAIDAELKLPGAVTDAGLKSSPSANSKNEVTPSPSAKNDKAKTGRKVNGVEVGSKVSLHTIASGDTLYSICEQYYGTASVEMAEALGSYNKLTPPNYDLFPGEILKIPEESVLKR